MYAATLASVALVIIVIGHFLIKRVTRSSNEWV